MNDFKNLIQPQLSDNEAIALTVLGVIVFFYVFAVMASLPKITESFRSTLPRKTVKAIGACVLYAGLVYYLWTN